MNILCEPYYVGNKVNIAIDVTFDNIALENKFISVTLRFTKPNRITDMLANNDVYSVINGSVHSHYSAYLANDLSGKYVITVAAFANGRFLGTKRETLQVECSDRGYTILRNPTLCWRTEDSGASSVFDINGNLFFLKGRLKKIWANADGILNSEEIASNIGLTNEEMNELVSVLQGKKILITRKKIKVTFRGNDYEFD